MYKFTVTYACSVSVPVGADPIERTAIVYGENVTEARNKVEQLDSDYYCIDNIVSEEVLGENKQ